MIFWTSASPSPVPRAFVVKNGREDPFAPRAGSTPGPLSVTLTRRTSWAPSFHAVDDDSRRHVRVGARLQRVAAQVAERLPQQHFVPFDLPNSPVDDDLAAPRRGFRADLLGRPLRRCPHVDRRQRQFRRLGEIQEIRDDLAERLGLVADALHVRPEFRRQPIEIEQAA